MLDLFNVNIGGGPGGNRRGRSNSVRVGQEIRSVTLPKAPELETTKFAKRVIRVLDVSGMDYRALAEALWEVAPDGVKRHLYALADALFDVAADRRERGLDYTMVEVEIATTAKALRDHLRLTGFVSHEEEDDDTLDYLEGLTPRN